VEADNPSEGFVVTAERDFKRQAQPLKDNFQKLLEMSCLQNPYPIKHKLRDRTMMKKLMTSGALASGDRPGGTQEEGVRHLFPGRWES
jgi:hypothetical protein